MPNYVREVMDEIQLVENLNLVSFPKFEFS